MGPRWFPGWPLYVCRNEYRLRPTRAIAQNTTASTDANPRAGSFANIKSQAEWSNLMPSDAFVSPTIAPKEEPAPTAPSSKGRKGKAKEKTLTPTAPAEVPNNFLQVVPFDPTLTANNGEQRTVPARKLRSPFLRNPNLRAPGRLLPAAAPDAATQGAVVKTEADEGEEESEDDRPIKIIGPRMTRRKAVTAAVNGGAPDAVASAAGPGGTSAAPGSAPGSIAGRKRKLGPEERSVQGASGGPAYVREAKIEGLPAETGTFHDSGRCHA